MKQTYVLIAKILSNCKKHFDAPGISMPELEDRIYETFCEYLAQDNPNFDSRRFLNEIALNLKNYNAIKT